ncbi:hypothetical protein FRZ03_33685, partial [Streptomyces misionensis]
MSDPSVTDASRAPDFLDRLIARHAATAPDTVRVRPRLPGPFERVEAVRARGAEPDTGEVTARPPAATAATDRDAPRRPAKEIHHHTRRERTVVRTEPHLAEAEPARCGSVRTTVRSRRVWWWISLAGRRGASRSVAAVAAGGRAVTSPVSGSAPRALTASTRSNGPGSRGRTRTVSG